MGPESLAENEPRTDRRRHPRALEDHRPDAGQPVAPDRRPLSMSAIVRLRDADGPAFVFAGVGGEAVMRLRSLVDSYHGP
jgi:hypothetical protein